MLQPDQRGRRDFAPSPTAAALALGMRPNFGDGGWEAELAERRTIAAEEAAAIEVSFEQQVRPWLQERRAKAAARDGVRLVDKSWYEHELARNRSYSGRIRRQRARREHVAAEQVCKFLHLFFVLFSAS